MRMMRIVVDDGKSIYLTLLFEPAVGSGKMCQSHACLLYTSEGTMALSNSQYESIMRVYNRTQLQKKHELDARVDEVYEKIPAVREMNDAITAAAVKSCLLYTSRCV